MSQPQLFELSKPRSDGKVGTAPPRMHGFALVAAAIALLWAGGATVGCVVLGVLYAQSLNAQPAVTDPWALNGWGVTPTVTVFIVNASSPSLQRSDVEYQATSRQLSTGVHPPVAGGVTRVLDKEGKTQYRMYTELVDDQPFGEYTDAHGITGANTIRHRIVHEASGAEAMLTAFGMNVHALAHENKTLVPNFFHFAYKKRPDDAGPSVSTFVSASHGTHKFHRGHGQAEWKEFMHPLLTHYWGAICHDYNLTRGSSNGRQLGWFSHHPRFQSFTRHEADRAIDWGEGKVDKWAGSEGEKEGSELGGWAGKKVGADLGEAAGGEAGPVGAMIGRDVGAWAGKKVGEWAGGKVGEWAGSHVGRAASSRIGGFLKREVNHWTA